ncbi:semaphorin-5A-like isoform X2 [Antedon mediterranea]|uniref:semaphorin-5A-like isoform X2 n=1 Tax=Antedon mediterranea TaxID=105859 RepID=UPI003AF7AA42
MTHYTRKSPIFSRIHIILFVVVTQSSLGITLNTDAYSHPYVRLYGLNRRGGLDDVSKIELNDDETQLIVGAKDSLLQLNASDLSDIHIVDWSVDRSTKDVCRSKGESTENCGNFIRVLLIQGTSVFVCGTYAFAPRCAWRNANDITRSLGQVSGVAKCPYNPQHNNTAIISNDGDLYTGTVSDFKARDPSIFRSMGPSPKLRAVEYNSKWLSEPNFVSSYEIGPFIYFFFRESAIEDSSCGKSVYSRVARICKNDVGGEYILDDLWTTFTKARINCSLPDSFPFYFNDLQSTHYIPEKGVIYGVFTTNRYSISGSAICRYHLSDLEDAFSSDYRYQHKSRSSWIIKKNSKPNFVCQQRGKRGDSTISELTIRKLSEASKYQLMEKAVQPTEKRPLFIEKDTTDRLTQIAVDVVKTKNSSYNVMFIGSEEGKILKLLKLPGNDVSCVVEKFDALPAGNNEAIKILRISKKKGVLFVGTNSQIIQVPVHRCDRFLTQSDCIDAKDPYCGWDRKKGMCTTFTDSFSLSRWLQVIDSCPVQHSIAVDGGYGPWLPWVPCKSPIGKERCFCRKRECDSPKPQNGGRGCGGDLIQVANCSGHWEEWSSWGNCSSDCGIGLQKRTRKCIGSEICFGNSSESRECNLAPCKNIKKAYHWTPWTIKNLTTDGYVLHRSRVACRANVESTSLIRITQRREQTQECSFNDASSCWPDSEYFGGYTNWSPWLPCTKTCDWGVQMRYRSCIPGHKLCKSGQHQQKTCKIAECPVKGQWNCWTAWSECSATCGPGVQHRYRTCTNPPPAFKGSLCVGDNSQVQQCQLKECPVYNGWKNWGDWSNCRNNRRHRARRCDFLFPVNGMCSGCGKEVEFCGKDIRDFKLVAGSAKASPSGYNLDDAEEDCAEKAKMERVYIVMVAMGSAIAGAVVCLTVLSSYNKHKTSSLDSELEDTSESFVTEFDLDGYSDKKSTDSDVSSGAKSKVCCSPKR